MAGGFVWTGFDYRGEPTPYGWPCINSHFGVLDVCDLVVAGADTSAELAPDEAERGVADAVVPYGVELSLVVVEVSGAGVVAKADVHAHIGPSELVAVTRAHDGDRVAEQMQRLRAARAFLMVSGTLNRRVLERIHLGWSASAHSAPSGLMRGQM